MDYNYPYFYTNTICNFGHLLADDNLKMIIINSLRYLVSQQLIELYGYVIMPNHIHLIWSMLKRNGKESPAGSFSKFTAHEFKKYLLQNNPVRIDQYRSHKNDRTFQFWKRDPLAVPLTYESILMQKLDYIHDNPIKEKWNLCTYPEDYRWSSASFYETGIDEFKILTHFKD